MAGCCGNEVRFDGVSEAYRRVLWAVITINATMFVVELTAGFAAGSMALKADSLDFLGDTLTYAISLAVIGMPLHRRAMAAMVKGLSLGAMGLWVAGATIWEVFFLGLPAAGLMGGIGVLAFAANLACFLLLLRFRNGDANVRSVWLCTRNDVIGNTAVVLAASGVWATGTGWPDVIVAGIMSALFLWSALQIIRQAMGELAQPRPQPAE